jgi:hypothetical protein
MPDGAIIIFSISMHIRFLMQGEREVKQGLLIIAVIPYLHGVSALIIERKDREMDRQRRTTHWGVCRETWH